jgi:DNA primase
MDELPDIVAFVSEYVRLGLTRSGYKGLCPFHFELTPSFTVDAEHQYFHCFGCGRGGDVVVFSREVQQHEVVRLTKVS